MEKAWASYADFVLAQMFLDSLIENAVSSVLPSRDSFCQV